MKIRLPFFAALLALLLTACSEDEEATAPRTYPVRMYVGLPAVYGRADINYNELAHPIAGATVKIYRTKEDYLLDSNILLEEKTDEKGELSFERDSTYVLWFRAYKDTLSNDRGVSSNNGQIEHNEIVIDGEGYRPDNNYEVFATLTNTPTKLRLLVYHEGQAVEGAQVQLYFTEQAYQDSLAAQEDSVHLRPTYGYRRIEASDSEKAFINRVKDYFLQTTNESGEVYFNNLEPRNYWFRITKDALSNEGMTVRTRESLPRDAEITTQMEVGIQ